MPLRYELVGNSKNSEIKYFGTDTTFTVFTFNGSGAESENWKQGGIVKDIILSADVKINYLVARHVQNLNFDRVFFYNAQINMNNFHCVNFFRCDFWGSPFFGRSDLNTINYLSEKPKFIMCFSSNSPIDIKDMADLNIIGCTMFAGDYTVETGIDNPASINPPDQISGFPVFISSSVFDAIKGAALDLNYVCYATITGNFISAGRDTGSNVIYINNMRSSSITSNTITYCGNYGIAVDDSEQYSLLGNILNGNETGGVALTRSKEISITGGSMGISYIRGGYYVQPVGLTDPGDTCTGILVGGVFFDSDMVAKLNLNTNTTTGNRVMLCSGVLDTKLSGPTAQRPTGSEMGQDYFDTTFGLPIYWNATSGHWQRADGTNV